MSRIASTLLLAAVAVPLLWSVAGAAQAGLDAAAWQSLMADPQTLRALGMSLWTGLASTALTLTAVGVLLSHSYGQPVWKRWVRWLAPMLAMPHAAFAIGLVAICAPSGWVLRALSPWATGFSFPPPWPTSQDPWGLGLIVVLVLKEIPFLMWASVAYLQRPDVAKRLTQSLLLAHTMGYPQSTAWWRVAWPQLMPRLSAPLLAVLAYSLTVVDMALVIGPTSPPTLAVLAWQWIQDADVSTNAQGAAAAWLLASLLAICAVSAWALATAHFWRGLWTRGISIQNSTLRPLVRPVERLENLPFGLVAGAYAAVLAALLVGSVSGLWAFPALLPQSYTWAAWQGVLGSGHALMTTVWLGLASSACATVWVVAWLELAPSEWRTRCQPLLYLSLALPAVLWVVGLHRVALFWGLDVSVWGLLLAHTLACLPYILLSLDGPYSNFDERLHHVASSLGSGRGKFLLRVKWPLLRSAMAASFAIGFSVSVAQYLPTLYVGAGRFTTVTTEAVNLAAGAQRSLTAAYAWFQWLLPVMVFAIAARLGRPRKFRDNAT